MIQKTSGTYWIDELKKNLIALNYIKQWENVCKFNYRKNYLDCFSSVNKDFGRFSPLFWNLNEHFNCDIHAGIGELRHCIRSDLRVNGKLHLITMLRNPVERYISEFKHVQRGATWFKSVRYCKELPLYSQNCYVGHLDWRHATWEDFITCDNNQANNRQVRMLADYHEIGCESLKCLLKNSNCTEKMKNFDDKKILENAKKNLRSLSFFGLTEYQALSQYLFEKTFENKLRFSKNLKLDNQILSSKLLETNEFKNNKNVIIEKNNLDMALYEYAEKIFFERISFFHNLEKK